MATFFNKVLKIVWHERLLILVNIIVDEATFII